MEGLGMTDRVLTDEEISSVCDGFFAASDWDGKRVLVIVPDQTRTCPLNVMFRKITDHLMPRTKQVDFIMALGTHPPMTEEMINERVGVTPEERETTFKGIRFFNHAWDDPSQLRSVGKIPSADIAELTGDLFQMDVNVTVNKIIDDYDVLLICGPVFPHEVVGCSGGNKYIFPGIGGEDILNFFHWLAAIITNPCIIGNKWTPVRKVVDAAAAMVPVERRALCMVTQGTGMAGLFGGTPEEAWSEAADLTRELHITFKDKPFKKVLSCAPPMYDEIWVAGKCMYKLEPVLAEGADLIIYAPHITEVSETHGKLIKQIGYHTRDYFLAQWDDFKHIAWGVLAHSTHVKGIGTYEDGVETPRANVYLATGIPEEECREINLGYIDHTTIDVDDFKDKEDEGILYVPKAGEELFRLTNPPPELGG